MGLSLPKSNLIFLKKCLDKWVHFNAKYLQKKAFRQKLENILSETEYEGMLEQVLEMLDEDKPIPRKMLYTGSPHSFGRKNGTKIYHLLKNVV